MLDWAPDEAVRNRIFVDNAATLYDLIKAEGMGNTSVIVGGQTPGGRGPAMVQQALADPTVIDYEATAALTADAQKITPVSGKAIACRPAE